MLTEIFRVKNSLDIYVKYENLEWYLKKSYKSKNYIISWIGIK